MREPDLILSDLVFARALIPFNFVIIAVTMKSECVEQVPSFGGSKHATFFFFCLEDNTHLQSSVFEFL